MEVEALRGVPRNDIDRHDDRRAKGDDPDVVRPLSQLSAQLSKRGSTLVSAAWERANTPPKEVSFRGIHEENDEVVASDR